MYHNIILKIVPLFYISCPNLLHLANRKLICLKSPKHLPKHSGSYQFILCLWVQDFLLPNENEKAGWLFVALFLHSDNISQAFHYVLLYFQTTEFTSFLSLIVFIYIWKKILKIYKYYAYYWIFIPDIKIIIHNLSQYIIICKYITLNIHYYTSYFLFLSNSW